MRIVFVRELPQWIIPSETAAYHASSKTIYIATKGRPLLKIIRSIVHEMGHYVACSMISCGKRLNTWLDSHTTKETSHE